MISNSSFSLKVKEIHFLKQWKAYLPNRLTIMTLTLNKVHSQLVAKCDKFAESSMENTMIHSVTVYEIGQAKFIQSGKIRSQFEYDSHYEYM